MKNLVLVCLGLALTACTRSATDKPVATTGSTTTGSTTNAAAAADVRASYNAAASGPVATDRFSVVSVAIAGDVTIKRGDKATIAFACDESVRARIVWRVSGGGLELRTEDGQATDKDKCSVAITTVALQTIRVAGSADVTADKLDKQASITVSGSGNVKIGAVDATALDVKIAGSGDVTATGKAEAVQISIAGSGDADLSTLEAARAQVSVSGSGDAKLWATETLDAKVIGSGNIAYKGAAKVTESKVGSGSIEKL